MIYQSSTAQIRRRLWDQLRPQHRLSVPRRRFVLYWQRHIINFSFSGQGLDRTMPYYAYPNSLAVVRCGILELWRQGQIPTRVTIAVNVPLVRLELV